MQHKTQKIVSMLLFAALMIGMLSIGMISAGAIRVFPETPIELNALKEFTNVEPEDRYYLTYTPDRDITVALEAGGSFRTSVQLFDSDNNFLDYSDDGGSGYNFRLISQLKAGETYTYLVYCHKAPTTYDADNFWVFLSEVIIPSDAAELTTVGWKNFTLNADDNDKWYRFTADDTNEFLFETMGFPEYWIGEYNPRYMLFTKLYDENMTKLKYQRSESRLGSSSEYIEKSGYLLEKGKTYYLNLRMVNPAADLNDVPGKITVSYETPEDRYTIIPKAKEVTADVTVRSENKIENELYFGYYTFTPKKTGKYRINFDNIYVDTGFEEEPYSNIVDFYNGNRRYIMSSSITLDENDASCSKEITLNADETYSFLLAVNDYAIIGDYFEFTVSPLFYVSGDADDDGNVGSTDATCIQRQLVDASVNVPEKTVKRNGDVDQNGTLDIVDATLIQRKLASMNVRYPIGDRIEL